MNVSSHLINAAVGPAFIMILIILDYMLKYNTDAFQRRLFTGMLVAALFANGLDFLHRILSGMPGQNVNSALYFIVTAFLIAQNVTYYLTFVFIDYFARQNVSRARRILRVLAVLFVVYLAVVVFNVKSHFFFYISADNLYTPAFLYFLRLIISYFSLLVILADILISSKHFKQSQIYLVSFFGILAALGATADIIFRHGSLTWPCFAAAVLYIYFFIVQSDSKIDSLTGIGNRLSFNEFIDKLSHAGSASKEAYSIVMIDMDHFKLINDTFGHLEGDNALRDMAAILKSSIRQTDFAARYGGDEFVLAAKAKYDIKKLMERIEQAITSQNELGKRPYKLQMSYGYDVYAFSDSRSVKDFLSHIDSLMYQNKMENREKEKPVRNNNAR